MSDGESLIIASKVKNYIKMTGDLKCSARVIEILTEKVRALCNTAIDNARKEGRKTVQEKDF